MNASRFDALASKVISSANNRSPAAPTATDRASAIAAIERALHRKRRQRLALRSLVAVAAVFVLGAGVGLVWHGRRAPLALAPAAPAAPSVTVVGHPTGGGATVIETGSPTPLADGRALAPGSRILSRSDGHVVLSLSTGTRLTVEEGGDISIVDSGLNQIFAIRAGAVRASVAKLERGQRFIIRTPDAEVEVRGTAFRVATAETDPKCGGGTVTRVSVYEGVVSVRHANQEARVPAGESWPTDCSVQPATAVLRSRRATLPVAPLHATGTAEPPAPVDEPETIASDLREQNDSFGRAFAAKRAGDAGQAIARFETFVARYPASPLVESALAQRMQLLRVVDGSRAATAAQQYLARFPQGFARSEAEAIVRRASSP